MFGKSLHQQEYKVLRKGLEVGLSKQQVSNLFNSQEALGNISPLTAIEKFSGARNGKILADFYDDCQDIPDPSALDPMQKNLLVLDDCFLGKQNKVETYYTRGRHKNCDTIYFAQNYFRLPRHTIRENSNFIILFPQDVKNLTHNFITIDLTNEWKVPPEFQPFLFSYWYYIKHTDQSSWKNLEIRSLHQNYYHTKWCCTRKLPKSGMLNVIQTKWTVKNELYTFISTICSPYGRVQITYVLFQSPTRSMAAHLESYLLHMYYTSQLDNLYNDREIDQLKLYWITWQRDHAQNKISGDSRISILKAMQCKL